MVIVDEDTFDPAAMLARMCAGGRQSGAVVSFTGLCRGPSDGAAVTALTLDAYASYTRAQIGRIEEEARQRWPLDEVLIRHRHGRIAPGEAIVFVGVAAAHRRAAFEAVDYLMDQLKTRAPFWKKEEGAAGAVWLEPRPGELARAARWNEAGGDT